MYRVILILLIVVCSATSAGARHHRHRYHVVVPDPYLLQHNAPVTGRLEPYQSDRSRSEVVRPPALGRDGTGGVIPPDWSNSRWITAAGFSRSIAQHHSLFTQLRATMSRSRST